MFFNLFVLSLATSFSVFLTQTYSSTHNFHRQNQAMMGFDTMSLAASTRVSKETNEFLADLQNYLKSAIQARIDKQAINTSELQNIFNDYMDSISPSLDNQLNQTIKYVVNKDASEGEKVYQITFINSSYLPAKLADADPSYVSTLVTQNDVERNISLQTLQSYFDGSRLKIAQELLVQLVGEKNAAIIAADPSAFAVDLVGSGMNVSSLPNGLVIEVVE